MERISELVEKCGKILVCWVLTRYPLHPDHGHLSEIILYQLRRSQRPRGCRCNILVLSERTRCDISILLFETDKRRCYAK